MNLMVNTNQKPISNTQTKKRKEPKHNIKDSHQIIREESKQKNKKRMNKKNLQKQSPNN